MSGDVHGQWDIDANHLGDGFQVVVDVVANVAVGASRVRVRISDDGHEVFSRVLRVFVEKHLHLARPFDVEQLAGLTAAI